MRRHRLPVRLSILSVLAVALGAAGTLSTSACGGHATYVKADDTALGRVVVYQNGIAYYERKATVLEDSLSLAVPHDKVDDFLKSLTVSDAKTGKTIPVSYPTRGASRGSEVDMTIQVPGSGPRDLVITYITESPAWKPTYRVVVDDEGKVELQGWAIVDNTSGEDWEDVKVGVGSSSALSFRYDLRTVVNVHREHLGGQRHFAHAPPTGGATVVAGGDGERLLAALGDDDIPRPDGHPDMADAELEVAEATIALSSRSGSAGGGRGGFAWGGAKAGRGSADAAPMSTPPPPRKEDHPVYRQRRTAEKKVKDLAQKLQSSAGKVVIEGYSAAHEGDWDGRSRERANLLKNQLIDEGIAPGRIEVVARGNVNGQRAGVQVKLEPVDPTMVGGAGPGGTGGDNVLAGSDQPVGESHFESDVPMTIRRGSSAMVSILDSKAEGEVVYLYDPNSPRGSKRFAFKALRFDNPTDSTLETGPVTVYGNGRFIGEGMTSSIPPGTTAVIPFALDRQVVVESNRGQEDRIHRLVTVQRGVMTAEMKHTRKTKLKITNRQHKETRVFVRHAVKKGWTLDRSPTVHEKLGEHHLFEIVVGPRQSTDVTIEESTPLQRTVDLRSPVGVGLVRVYLESPRSERDDKLQAAIAAILKIHDDMVDHRDAITNLHERMNEYRMRSSELHDQIASLKAAKVGGSLMSHLKRKLKDMSQRIQSSTIEVVEHQEQMMLARIRFQDAVSELSLKRPKAEAKRGSRAKGAPSTS